MDGDYVGTFPELGNDSIHATIPRSCIIGSTGKTHHTTGVGRAPHPLCTTVEKKKV